MTQFRFDWSVGIALSLVLATAGGASAQRPRDRANFVLVMCDDLGWGDVGFQGNRIIKTPHLDAMAKSSLQFRRFYAASAVCSPTRGAVMTGRHPYRYGIPTANAGHMKAEEQTLAEILKALGYATGHFGKWHLGTLTKTVRDSNRGGARNQKHYSPPWENGFDVCFSTEAKAPTYDPMRKPKENASSRGWDVLGEGAAWEEYGTYYWNERGERVRENLEGDDSRVIMDRVVPFIEESASKGVPFFVVIWFHTPHLPVVAGPKHAAMYSQYESYPRNYYGCVTAMDEQIGRLRQTLREAGVAEQTMLAFCSDNGPEGKSTAPGSAGPFRGRKRDLFEGGIRVPGLIEWPGRIRPGATDYPAVTSDYLPTILSIVGTKAADARPIDGVDLTTVFENRDALRPRPIGFQFGGRWAWSDNRYKLVFYPAERKNQRRRQNADDDQRSSSLMLFDLLEDPRETNNLAEKMPDRVKEMKAAFEAWRGSCQRSSQGADYATASP